MDQFDLFGIPIKKQQQNTVILIKLDPVQLSLLQGSLVYLYHVYGLQYEQLESFQNLGPFSSGDLIISF